MAKLCVVYNFAQLYREPIFKLIDRQWDCEWFFGHNTTDIKGMDPKALKVVTFVNNRHLVGPAEWQTGIAKLMRQRRFDRFLMLGEPMNLSTWWSLLQRHLFFRKKRIYLWSHGWYGREGFVKKWMKRAFFGMADHVFTYGEYAKRQAIKQGFDGSKITPIHNSLDFENQSKLRNDLTQSDIYRTHFGNDNPTLIFIGRLTKVKKLHQLLEAVAKLKERGENYNVVFVGDGVERKNLENKAAQLDIPVWFYGSCYDDTQNAQLIYDADLCVAPGNVGLTAMHTMAFGTPVLTHDNFPNQMPEFEAIVDGKTGAFFKEDDINSLADAISNWFKSHKSERETVREACVSEIATSWCPSFQLQILKDNLI